MPYTGVLLTAGIYLLGILLDVFVKGQAFEIALNFSALGIIGMWIMIMVANLGLQRRARQGLAVRPKFRLPGAPYTNYLTIVFLVAVFGLSWYDDPAGRIMIIGSPGIAILMIIGWFAVRQAGRRGAAAADAGRQDRLTSTCASTARGPDLTARRAGAYC